ncbi:MAG: FAD:protein FMN transferase [Lachnospiraceae bacterium]|nr:FAD:protein FMN transferase [Lachnospiraceae bacterium]
MIKSHHLKSILYLWGVAFFALLCGCARTPDAESAPAAEKQTAEVFAMDTVMELTVYGDAAVLKSAEDIITGLEHKLSVTDEGSEIYRLNRDKQADVSEDTLELIGFAKDICERTDGALDITVYPIVKAWGFTTGEYRIPSAEELQKLLLTVNYKELLINGSTVALPGDSMIDLGSVAKGYTGDRLIGHFRANGITSAIVSLGGNVQTLGTKPDGSPWRVGIADPFGGEYAGALSVRDKCVITSGSYQRFFEENGVRYHHIIDPSTGSPAAGGFVSVTVVGDKGVLCDALSTALFVMGKDKAFDFCSSNSDFDALFIDEDGRIYITAGIADDFTPSGNYKNSGITVLGK